MGLSTRDLPRKADSNRRFDSGKTEKAQVNISQPLDLAAVRHAEHLRLDDFTLDDLRNFFTDQLG